MDINEIGRWSKDLRDVKIFMGDRHTAFYVYTIPDTVLAQNQSS
jgi:hypothetical protein